VIAKLKHSEFFNWVLKIWLILFVAFLYTQFSNIHTHSIGGRLITHSHATPNQTDRHHSEDTPFDKPANHKHTKNEFFYYSFLNITLATILIVASFLLIFAKKEQIVRLSTYFSVRKSFYFNTSLRAPPAL